MLVYIFLRVLLRKVKELSVSEKLMVSKFTKRDAQYACVLYN